METGSTAVLAFYARSAGEDTSCVSLTFLARRSPGAWSFDQPLRDLLSRTRAVYSPQDLGELQPFAAHWLIPARTP